MKNSFHDLETYSEVPIRDGIHRYAEGAEVLLWAYALEDEPVRVWDVASGAPMPADLAAILADEDVLLWWHNGGMFDTVVLSYVMPELPLPPHRLRDSMVLAYMHSLPGGLDLLCDIVGVADEKRKLKEGKDLVRLFCVPPAKNLKRGRATQTTHPEQWERFKTYAGNDIEAMRVVIRSLPKWNLTPAELDLWRLDMTINRRGVAVDVEFVHAAISEAARVKKALAERTVELTEGEVEAATQRDRLLAHILMSYGVSLPDMQSATLERRLEDETLPEPVRELIEIRLRAGMASVSKYQAFARATSTDGRLRGTLQFGGAMRTSRWAGRLVQLHNLSRVPKYLKKVYDMAVESIKAGCTDMLWENPMEVIGSTVRGTLIAPPGRKFCRSDLSNIEGRALAWHAGEQWKVDAFAAGQDLYVLGYARSFGVSVAEVEADEEAGGTMRLIGKVQELALGYQGAVGAFGSMAKLYGVDLPEERIVQIVKAWRAANAAIVSFWYELEDSAKRAIASPGLTVDCRRLKMRRDGAWLRIRLPSGRYLCYPGVRLDDGKITFMGLNRYTRAWERVSTYGGSLVENVTQATARDVLAESLKRIESAGYPIVLHVHDEVIAETPDTNDFSGDELARLLSTAPAWAQGLPLAADGEELHRYRK